MTSEVFEGHGVDSAKAFVLKLKGRVSWRAGTATTLQRKSLYVVESGVAQN